VRRDPPFQDPPMLLAEHRLNSDPGHIQTLTQPRHPVKLF